MLPLPFESTVTDEVIFSPFKSTVYINYRTYRDIAPRAR